MKTFEIRHLIKGLRENKMEVTDTFQEAYERTAKKRYDEYKKYYPSEYFELIEVEHNEKCLFFTPIANGVISPPTPSPQQ